MNLFGILDVSGSALNAERQRAEIVTSNLANAETTHTPQGGPYQRQMVVFGTRKPSLSPFARAFNGSRKQYGQGVRVESIVADTAPPLQRFEPSHPDANKQGYVSYPVINPIEEMANLMEAARAYQLNVAAVQATKGMITASLDILR
ncbi:MAG: flagellar basal body rod protein FlgC [Terriglobia bacterium]